MLKKIGVIGYATALATAPAWITACSASTTSTPSSQSAQADPTAEAGQEASYLFSLTADSMRFENQSGQHATLQLDGVDPSTIWFTDRPVRDSGVIATSQFAKEWEDGQTFQQDPPNAALVLHQPITVGGGVAETLVVELEDATYDPAKGTFRTDVRVLTPAEADGLEGGLASHGDRHDAAWPSEAEEVSLFIDSTASIVLCTTPSTCNSNGTKNYTYNSTIYFSTTTQSVS